MKKSILLINPWIYDFAAYDYWVSPLGLLSLASVLRINGYAVRVIDCLAYPAPACSLPDRHPPRRHPSGHGKFHRESIEKPPALGAILKAYHRYGMPPEGFLRRLRECAPPDLVLVTSVMTYWYPAVFDIIRLLKREFAAVPVLLGGTYATLCPGHAARSGADRIVCGEGEPQLPKLLKDVLGDDCAFAVNPDDLDSYPYPAFDLTSGRSQISLLTSRGCPFHCRYCASSVLHPRFRRRNPARVADEIEYWQRSLGVGHFSFYDDALLVDPDALALPLFREIASRKLPCRFHCPNGLHLREVTPELARAMFRAGVQTLRFGFETADVRRQLETGGKVDNEELRRAVAYLKEAGYRSEDIGVYVLCGLPGQTAAEVMRSISYVRRCGARPMIAEYSPIPGTDLWDEAVQGSPDPIADEPLFHNNSLLPCRSADLTYEMYRECKRHSRIP